MTDKYLEARARMGLGGETLDERLDAQNQQEPWIDCNERGRPHHWVWETDGESGTWFTCKRCPVATVSSRLDSDGRRVHPAPWLR